MRICKYFVILASLIAVASGCGRKGDPVRPEIPKLNPLRNVSASVTSDAIVLSWNAPVGYDTGKPLDVMRDIRTITISRKQESSTDHFWDFAMSRDGWNAFAETLPVKWASGTVRAASPGVLAGIMSPENLALPASQYRYIALSLWTHHAERAHLVFLTDTDTTWDFPVDLRFQSAVHTSVLSYQRAFAAQKIKALPLLPQPGRASQAQSYVVDMSEIPAWTGTIRQVGVLVSRAAADTSPLELGLDALTIQETASPAAALYDASPWGFWQDAEGWRAHPQHVVSEASGGVLYLANATGPILAMSAPGQRIPWRQSSYVQVRMLTAKRTQAYILLRGARDPRFEKRSDRDLTTPSTHVLPITLQPADDFQVYTIECPDLANEIGTVSQIGLYFPEPLADAIMIDYIASARSQRLTEALGPMLLQKNIPPFSEVAERVRQQVANHDPGFEVAYAELASGSEVFDEASVTLARVSPSAPGPVVIRADGGFAFSDTGSAADAQGRAAPFRRGERYTYLVELVDNKGQVSALPEQLSVNVPYIPSAPLLLGAAAGDREVRLTWMRPFLDTNGGKLREFDGYHIYRTTAPGQYTGAPLYQAAVNDVEFVDANVANGTTYYYVVRAVAAVTATEVVGEASLEIAATPLDTIAPDAPTALTSAYLAGVVKLFWNFSASPDWQGFHVYRGLAAEGPFQQLNAQPVRQPAYDDTTILPKQQYFYYITAIDTAQPPNESVPSNMIRVTTPKR